MGNIALIRPPSLVARWVPALIATPPLGLAYLAGALASRGHRVTVIDAVGEAIHQRTSFDETFASYGLTVEQILDRIPKDSHLVGITSMFTQEWPSVRRLAEAIRARFPAVRIVCGGEHITAEPLFSLTDCPAIDFCILGEGEQPLCALLEAVEAERSVKDLPGVCYLDHGNLIQNARCPRITCLDTIPWPRWDLTPIENYLREQLGFGVRRGRSMPMLATRGCPYQCTFCSSPQMWTTRWVPRSPEDVVREIEHYIETYRIDNVDFYDLTAIVRKEWIIAFADLLIQKNLKITWQLPSGTRAEKIDDEVCDRLFRAGCRNMTFAPESGAPSVLRRIKKRVKLDQMVRAMKSAVRHGINTKYNVVLGFPGETHREVAESLRFIVQTAWAGVHDLSIWLFSPYPGSELYEELKQEGRIALNQDYFIRLSAYSDFSNAVSWNPRMRNGTLKAYRLLGTAIFYFVSYGCRPYRIVRLIRNLASGKHESRLETVLAAMWARVKARRQRAQG